MAAVDIRKKISKFLDEYAHMIIYVRKDKRFRCICYSERSGESMDPNCPKCFGTSYKVKIEKTRARRSSTSIPETKVGSRFISPNGQMEVSGYVYYMEYDTDPEPGDLILEVEWKHKLPVKILEKLEISAAEPQEGYQGRVEFYQVYCRTEWLGVKDNDTLHSN